MDVLQRNMEQLKFPKREEPDTVVKWDAEFDAGKNKKDEAITKSTDALNEVRSNHTIGEGGQQVAEEQKECAKSSYSLRFANLRFLQRLYFKMHKWHSNARKSESSSKVNREEMETFAKQQLGVTNGDQAGILGLPWDKETDTIGSPSN